MYNSIFKYNDLDNSKVTRSELLELIELAKSENQIFIVQKISDLLRENPNDKCFKITLKSKIPTFQIEDGLFGAFEPVPQELQNENGGLGEPGMTYKDIAKILLDQIKTATGKGYTKKWNEDSELVDNNKRALNGFSIPINFTTKKPYKGINILMLKEYNEDFFTPFKNPYFLTLKQIQEKGGALKENAKPMKVLYYNVFPVAIHEKVTKEQMKIVKSIGYSYKEEAVYRAGLTRDDIGWRGFLKDFDVYNGQDVDGINFELDKIEALRVKAEQLNNKLKIEAAEKIIASYPEPKPTMSEFEGGAYYVPQNDYINVPPLLSFETPQDYYRALFHELTHSTGHVSRLNRKIKNIFGTEDYAKEELTAEFGAVFLTSYAGINWITNRNHPEYIKNWLKVIKQAEENPNIVLRAVINAKNATDFIAKKYLEELTESVAKTTKTITKKQTKKAVAKAKTPKPKQATKKNITKTEIKKFQSKDAEKQLKELQELWNNI